MRKELLEKEENQLQWSFAGIGDSSKSEQGERRFRCKVQFIQYFSISIRKRFLTIFVPISTILTNNL